MKSRLYLRAMWAAAEMSFRQLIVDSFFVFGTFLMPIIYAILGLWMLGQRGGNYAIFVVVGSGLMGLWTTLLFSSGNGITAERWTGTLETIVAVPTPMWVIVFGKTLASVFQSLGSMLASYLLVSFLFGYPLTVAQPLLFLFSIVIGLVSLGSFGLMLAPLFILNPMVQRFQNSMEYPVYILAGFMFPIAILPGWTTPLSFILSPYWAARILHATSNGAATSQEVALCWGVMLLLTAVYAVIAVPMFNYVLYKARVEATLNME